jgi:hypothetical protein
VVNLANACPEDAKKILKPVPYSQGFHFFMPDGHYTGETALSLCSFLRDLDAIDVESVKFHFDRGDFQKWIKHTLGDEELARHIDGIKENIPEDLLLEKLKKMVQKRISELQQTR